MGQMTKTMSGQMAFLAKLRQYSSEMGSLRSQHHRQVEWAKLLSTGVLGQYAGSCETMNTAIGAFSSDVREQLDLLDQNIRDMLQLVGHGSPRWAPRTARWLADHSKGVRLGISWGGKVFYKPGD